MTQTGGTMHHDRLLDAVDQLTKPRNIHTTITDDDSGEWLRVHTEQHPALLDLLLEGTQSSKGPKSSEIKLPIDADALELWGQIRDLVKLWCKKLGVTFDGWDLASSLRNWFLAHSNAVRAGKVGEATDFDITRMVEGWVRMIEQKYDPQEKREWKEHCIAEVTYQDEGGLQQKRKCGARRINHNGTEEFAIQLNVGTLTAECRRCRTRWVGEKELAQLRFLTNLDVMIRNGQELDQAARGLIAS